MKYGAGVLCASVTLLGLSAPVSAADAPAGSNLQAGGLKPPEAVQSDPTPPQTTQTEAALDRADKEDSGRGLEFAWLNAELGPQYVGLQALKSDNLVDGTLVESKGFGMGYGAGIGARLLAGSYYGQTIQIWAALLAAALLAGALIAIVSIVERATNARLGVRA